MTPFPELSGPSQFNLPVPVFSEVSASSPPDGMRSSTCAYVRFHGRQVDHMVLFNCLITFLVLIGQRSFVAMPPK